MAGADVWLRWPPSPPLSPASHQLSERRVWALGRLASRVVGLDPGVRRPGVTEALKALRQRGLIFASARGNQAEINDRKWAARVAGETYGTPGVRISATYRLEGCSLRHGALSFVVPGHCFSIHDIKSVQTTFRDRWKILRGRPTAKAGILGLSNDLKEKLDVPIFGPTQNALDYNSTIIGALELSEKKWVLAVQLPGVEPAFATFAGSLR